MKRLNAPLEEIKERVDDKRLKVLNPKNTYEDISVISLEDLYAIFDEYTIGEDEDEDKFINELRDSILKAFEERERKYIEYCKWKKKFKERQEKTRIILEEIETQKDIRKINYPCYECSFYKSSYLINQFGEVTGDKKVSCTLLDVYKTVVSIEEEREIQQTFYTWCPNRQKENTYENVSGNI